MSKKRNIEIVKNICDPLAEELGYELVDVEFVKEDSSYFLRIYLDKPGGINLDDCQKMSELVSEQLDEKDPIPEAYYLEVSSPGLDRPLKNDKDFKRNIGKEVEVKLYKALNGKKMIEGILEGYTDSELILRTESDELVNLPKEDLSLVKLAVKF